MVICLLVKKLCSLYAILCRDFPRFFSFIMKHNFSNTNPQAKYPQRKNLAHFNNETIIKHHQQALKFHKYRKLF